MVKKSFIIYLIAIFVFVLIAPCLSFAGTVGNSAMISSQKGAGLFSMRRDKNIPIKVGFDAEFLFDRDLHANASSNAELTGGEWYMAKISYTMFNRFEPYVKMGIAHIKARWTEAGADAQLESDSNFAWALGGKLLVWQFDGPRIQILTDGFYRVADLDAEEGRYDGSVATLNTASSRFEVREWQIALLAATEIDVGGPAREEVLGITSIVPYAGLKYSDIGGRLRLVHNSGLYNNPGEIESDKNFGMFVGCDFVGPNSVLLNLEGRFIDETAMTAGLEVLF